jgi:hypothetical protein
MGAIAEDAAAHDARGIVAEDGGTPDRTVMGNDGGGAPDDGPTRCDQAIVSDGGSCPGRTPTTVTIVGSTYSAQGSSITYGAAPDVWNVYAFADPGQALPSLTPSAGALSISATLARPITGQNSAGFGVSIDGTECVDESNFASGLVFDVFGDLGGCALYVDAVTSQDESFASDPCRATCTADAGACIAPSVQITSLGMNTLPNMSFLGGSPSFVPDTSKLIGFRWRLQTPDAAAGIGCTANFTIGNISLLGR